MTVATHRPVQADRPPCPGPCAGLCTESGFAAAYREHRPRLLSRARAVLGDPELAEDAVHDAFLRAWAACGSFDPSGGSPLISWLTTIARNVSVDRVRARASRPRMARAQAEQSADAADRRATVDSAVLRIVLVDALATVSDEHRSAVVAAVLHDRSYADVAAELGVPVGTVKSRVFYGLRGMRGALEEPAVRRPACQPATRTRSAAGRTAIRTGSPAGRVSGSPSA